MIFGIDKVDRSRAAMKSPDGRTVTYGGLCDAAESMKKFLPERALAFCMCSNTPGSVIGYISLMAGGAAVLLLDAHLPSDQFERFYGEYRPSLIWCPDGSHENCSGHLKKQLCQSEDYSLWDTGNPVYPLSPDLTLLLATSGSTGNPKLVRLSKLNLESNAESICEYLKIDENERAITTLPMNYTYGLSIINSHLMVGACLLMTPDSYVQSPFWEFFEQEKATSFGGVPYTYELLKKIHIFNKKLPSLHYMTQAGGKLPTALQIELAQWSAENGRRFYVMYGQTEATARMAYLPPQNCLKKPGSMGIAIPGGRFELVDENGNVITQHHKSGELVYSGPNVCLGYAQQKEDLALGDENHGRLMTGDIAETDEDDYYYIVGRKKRFLKLFGIRINLTECENILQEKYPQDTIICGGTDNNLKIYTADPDAARGSAAILADYLHINRKGFTGCLIDRVPRNAYGKIQFSSLDAAVQQEFHD